jgi:hypothetical protein
MRTIIAFVTLLGLAAPALGAHLSRAAYEDRVHAAWLAQILATLMGFRYEHKVASVRRIDTLPRPYKAAPVDDDWYYEMVAVRAFDRYGTDMTVEELGTQWKENSAGTWGSSREALRNLRAGVAPAAAGHPRHNPLWWSIGPQFSSDVYGLLAPGLPNLAARLARTFGHINGYAEGTDGAVFVAGMVSLAFVEKDPRAIVRKAARLIHPSSPYRQCLNQVIAMADAGKGPAEIAAAVEDRWHIEYPATNNAVANGGIVAIAVWFGRGDFLETVNMATQAGDYTDADCNAANAATVVGALRGTRAIPPALVAALGDRIVGADLGGVPLTPPVDERISELARRTARIGEVFVRENGGRATAEELVVTPQAPVTQPPERFVLADLAEIWTAGWALERAGFGGGNGGLGGIRGMTHLRGDVLATWPRDEVRGVVLRRNVTLGAKPTLSLDVGVDPGRAWKLELYVDDERILSRIIEAPRAAQKEASIVWQSIREDLPRFAGRQVQIRLYQLVLFTDRVAGTAYWRALELK